MEIHPHGRHIPPPKLTRSQLEKEFASDDPKRITHALYAAFYAEPAKWVQEWCFKFITSPHPAVRAEAILTLGHLAIREFRAIDSARAFTAARQKK